MVEFQFFSPGPKPTETRLPEATVADLQVMFFEYRSFLEGCEYKPGDLVTPKVGHGVKGAGEPHIVLEVVKIGEPSVDGEPGSTTFGKRYDMRIAQFIGEQRYCYWVESFTFERWKAPEAEAAVEPTLRIPGSYDPTDPDDVKLAVLTFLGDGEKDSQAILDGVDASVHRVSDALRELCSAYDVAHRQLNGRDFYRILVEEDFI